VRAVGTAAPARRGAAAAPLPPHVTLEQHSSEPFCLIPGLAASAVQLLQVPGDGRMYVPKMALVAALLKLRCYATADSANCVITRTFAALPCAAEHASVVAYTATRGADRRVCAHLAYELSAACVMAGEMHARKAARATAQRRR
jgi:hypothetical protein